MVSINSSMKCHSNKNTINLRIKIRPFRGALHTILHRIILMLRFPPKIFQHYQTYQSQNLRIQLLKNSQYNFLSNPHHWINIPIKILILINLQRSKTHNKSTSILSNFSWKFLKKTTSILKLNLNKRNLSNGSVDELNSFYVTDV